MQKRRLNSYQNKSPEIPFLKGHFMTIHHHEHLPQEAVAVSEFLAKLSKTGIYGRKEWNQPIPYQDRKDLLTLVKDTVVHSGRSSGSCWVLP